MDTTLLTAIIALIVGLGGAITALSTRRKSNADAAASITEANLKLLEPLRVRIAEQDARLADQEKRIAAQDKKIAELNLLVCAQVDCRGRTPQLSFFYHPAALWVTWVLSASFLILMVVILIIAPSVTISIVAAK
jgi:hypothetical protein